MSDLISRQAAISAIQQEYADTEGGDDKCAVWKNVGLTSALHIMQDLPSAQPKQDGFTAWEMSVADSYRKKAIIEKYRDYQIEWLTSHCDLEFCEKEENALIRLLRDTAECFLKET